MTAAHTKKYNKNGTIRQNYYYVCSLYTNKGSAVCNANAIRADDFERWFFGQIQELVINPRLLKQIVVAVNAKRDKDRKPLEDKRKRLEKELASFGNRQQRCFELFEDGHIDQSSFVRRLTELKGQQTILQVALQGVEQKLSNHQMESIHSDRIHNALKQFQKMILTAPVEQQKKLLRSLFDKITLPLDRLLKPSSEG